MNALKKETSTSAQDVYLEKHLEANSLLEELQRLLIEMPAPCSSDWTHVGSLEYLCSQLRNLKEHFSDNN